MMVLGQKVEVWTGLESKMSKMAQLRIYACHDFSLPGKAIQELIQRAVLSLHKFRTEQKVQLQ